MAKQLGHVSSGDDRPRVRRGQAYKRKGLNPALVNMRFIVADEKPEDMPTAAEHDRFGYVWAWTATEVAPPLHEVELVRPYDDQSVLGTYLVDGDESFFPEELAAAKVEQRTGIGCAIAATSLDLTWEQRQLDQHETDMLILAEIHDRCPSGTERMQLIEMFSTAILMAPTRGSGVGKTFTHQRYGIASEPLVRILAHRTWGDRDRLFDIETEKTRWNLQRDKMIAKQEAERERRKRDFDDSMAIAQTFAQAAGNSSRDKFLHQNGCSGVNCDGQCVEGYVAFE